jgi:putative ABC transport system permease protein
MTVIVRSALEDPTSLIPGIRAAVAEMDASIPPVVTTYSDVLSEAVARQRLGAALLAAFGVASLLLTAVGIYGLMSYSVTQRSSEIAVRSALGAQAADLRRMIVARSLYLAIAGSALGLAGAWAARTAIASQLQAVSMLDPVVLGSVCLGMLAVAVLSAYLPARRAAGIDPSRVLRED